MALHDEMVIFLFAFNALVLLLFASGKLVARSSYEEIVYHAVKQAIRELRDEGHI